MKLAVSASLLLHVGLAAWMLNSRIQHSPHDTASPARHYIELSILQPRQQAAEPEVTAEAVDAPQSVEPLRPAPRVLEEPVTLASPTEAAGDPGQEPAESDMEGEPSVPRLNPAQLNAAISQELTRQRSELGRAWVADCMRQEEEKGLRECPQDELIQPAHEMRERMAATFRTTVNAEYLEDQELRALEAEMEQMQALMGDESLVGLLARERYRIARTRHWELEPPLAEGGTITLLSVGTGGLGGLFAQPLFSLGEKLSEIAQRESEEPIRP